jgi:hypothetical protein
MIAKTVCKVMGVVFLVVAAWGFIAGDRVLIFHVNTAHNLVHLLSGLAALAAGFGSVRAARAFCLIFGAVYGLVGVLGFAGVAPVVDLLHLNTADNWLHVFIAVVFLAAGLLREPAGAPVVRARPAGAAGRP